MAKRKAPIGAVLVSDLHVGSDVALWPDNFITKNKNHVGIGNNVHQRWLLNCWEDATKRAIAHFGDDPFVVICVGDLIEGDHRNTKEIMSSWEMDMCNAAVQLLSPLCSKAQDRYFIYGTKCHVEEFEPYICKELKGKFCGHKANLEIHGSLLDIAHHMPTTMRAYLEASALSILMGNARLNRARSGHRIPRLYARGHRHVGGAYTDFRSTIVVTGAWQLLTNYGHKVAGDSLSAPSMAILDWRGLPLDSIPAIKAISYEIDEDEPIKA